MWCVCVWGGKTIIFKGEVVNLRASRVGTKEVLKGAEGRRDGNDISTVLTYKILKNEH